MRKSDLHRVEDLDPLWSTTHLDNLRLISGAYQGLETLRLSEAACRRLSARLDLFRSLIGFSQSASLPASKHLAACVKPFILTPMTLLIDESGTIEEVWRGALHGATLESAQKRLGINLPGLVP